MSNRLLKLLKEKETHFFLLALGCVLLNWPLVQVFLGAHLLAGLVKLFLLWAIIILVLFLVSRSCTGLQTADEKDPKDRDRS